MADQSERFIASLLPSVQPYAREFLKQANALCPPGFSVRIISGNRTYAEQNALYAQGRTKPGPIVTNARGGQSNHNFRIAWDVGIFQGNRYLGSHPLYAQLGPVGEALGLEWGGRWKKLRDTPHYQAATGLTTAELRAYVAAGRTIPVKPFGSGSGPAPERFPVIIQEAENGKIKTLAIPAFLIAGRTFVALRAFTDHFGGEIEEADGPDATIWLNEQEATVPFQVIDGKGFASFSTLNRLLGLDYTYKGGVLTVLVDPGP